jgi:glycosyltransferase involved in cell wall biosynthesis
VRDTRYSCLDAIYFVSNDSLNDFIELFGEFPNMGVVYNLIDAENVIKKSLEPFELKTESGTIFSAIGSLFPVKGFDRLLRAAKIARDEGYQFEVHIAGDGPEKNSLEKFIRQSGLEEVVRLHGFMSNPYPLLKKSDIFIMSSVSEALPTVLCEAMILGKPSLVTNCSGCRGLVESGEYGLMAEQDDHDLAQKMMLYMDSPELQSYYAQKSAERSSLFNDEEILEKYYKIFDWEQVETVYS